MPNIFKRFLQPNASDFVFPDVEELVEEEPADTAGEQEGEPEESAPETEEKDTPSAVDFAQIQAEKILEDARRQAEDYLARRQMEAEQEAEQVRQQAQSEGYRQGYAEGLRQAGVEGQAELQKQREQQAEELQAFLEKATAAREELGRIAGEIQQHERVYRVHEGSLPGMKSHLANFGFNKFARSAKPFFAQDICNGCGQCARNCPAHAITLRDGKPVWAAQCFQCLRCINECPRQAIQYGKATAGRHRYTIRMYLPQDEQ